MKLTVEEVVASCSALRELGGSKFAIQTALKIAKNRRLCDEVGREFENRRAEMAKEYGKPNDQGMIQIPNAVAEEFNKKDKLIRDEEIELELEIIHIDDLKFNDENVDIEPNVLVPLWWMLDVSHRKQPRKRTKR